MKTYDSQEEKEKASVAAEPVAAYDIVNPSSLTYPISVPDGDEDDEYMTLEQFGDLFHQKLDACYASLQGQDK